MKQMMILTAALLLAAACAPMTTDDAAVAGALPESDIAAIVTAAHEGEIQQGNAAASRATSADVRAFAQMLVTDHTNALNNARTVFSTHNITPTDNDTTSTLRSESSRAVTNLATYSGAAFDRRYVQAQVDVHQWMLTTLDTALIPSARTPELRTLLQTQRGSVATHLDRARTLLGSL